MSSETIDEKNKKEQKKNKEQFILPEKKFELRESLLTTLFENPHIETIYHIFAVILIGLIVNTAAHDILKTGNAKLGIQIVLSGFSKIHITAVIWVGEFLSSCLCYPCLFLWAKCRTHFSPKSGKLALWDSFWFFVVPVYYFCAFKISGQLVTDFQIPPASAAIVIFEMVRMMMKVHAFIRENASKVLRHKPHSDEPLNLPQFSTFMYYFFAPTLIYRDEYPRTSHIRWGYVCTRAFEVLCIILNIGYLIERLIKPSFQEFGLRTYTVTEIFLCICEMSFAGMLLKLYGFYFMLHSWSNLWAELLRFGDRKFYSSWWIATSYAEYFRTWNILVGDWLYTYVYKDMYEVVVPRNKIAAKFAVFMLSAMVHEWLMCYMLGYFVPIMFIFFFFFSGPMSFIKAPKLSVLNILFWYGLAYGSGTMVCVYTMEFYARANTPSEVLKMKDYFVPQMFKYITY